MAKMKKMEPAVEAITAEELTKLQGLVSKINEGQTTLGGLELQKATIIEAVVSLRKELTEMQGELQKVYGDVNINISTGEITKDASNPQD